MNCDAVQLTSMALFPNGPATPVVTVHPDCAQVPAEKLSLLGTQLESRPTEIDPSEPLLAFIVAAVICVELTFVAFRMPPAMLTSAAHSPVIGFFVSCSQPAPFAFEVPRLQVRVSALPCASWREVNEPEA